MGGGGGGGGGVHPRIPPGHVDVSVWLADHITGSTPLLPLHYSTPPTLDAATEAWSYST